MKHYFNLFFSLLRAHQKSILIVVFSFILGIVYCYFSLASVMSGIQSKDWQLNTSSRLIIDSDALAAINREDYAKAKRVLERDLLSQLKAVFAKARLQEPDGEIDDKILEKAFAAFCKIDKAKLLKEMSFESEDDKKSFISTIDALDVFFRAKGFAAPAAIKY